MTGRGESRVLDHASYTDLARMILDWATTPPFLVGVAGPVAVGKSTAVRALRHELESRSRRVEVLSTDAFLLPYAVLNERQLLMRKGFPESYDGELIRSVLSRLRAGETASAPIYSHDTYDIVPDVTQTLTPADITLIEGIVALQEPLRGFLDLAVYIDAPEELVKNWYVGRFVQLTEDGRADASSFYHRLSSLPAAEVRRLAEGTWEAINGPNLREHIAPSAAHADIVVVKAKDHSIVELRRRGDLTE